MYRLFCVFILIASWNVFAATHCQTAPDYKWEISVSVDVEQITYSVTGRKFKSPRIQNSDGSFNLFDDLRGDTIFIRKLMIDGNEGEMSVVAVDLRDSEFILREKVSLVCVTVQ